MTEPLNRYDRPMRQVSTVSLAMLLDVVERAYGLVYGLSARGDHADVLMNLGLVMRSCREALEPGDDLVFPFDAD